MKRFLIPALVLMITTGCAAPPVITFSPTGGPVLSTDSLTITTNATASIYYTSDGTTFPVAGDGTLYSEPIIFGDLGLGDSTVRAIAQRGGRAASRLAEASFNISEPISQRAEETIVYTFGETETDSIELIMRYVPPKTFYTGFGLVTSTVSTGYYMSETELFSQLMVVVLAWAGGGSCIPETGENCYTFRAGRQGSIEAGNANSSPQHPTTLISWHDAVVFANAITEFYNARNESAPDLEPAYVIGTDIIRTAPFTASDLAEVPGATGFRLPTRSEWELAARYIDDNNNDGDITDPGEYYPGNYASGARDADFPSEVAWYSANSAGRTHEVKSKTPNALGLYDMSGNVREWSITLVNNTEAVHLGGSWNDDPDDLEVARSGRAIPTTMNTMTGFRLMTRVVE